MEKIFNGISIFIGIIGGVVSYYLGGFDNMLIALTALIILDYITGVLKAIYGKKLSSEIGFKGIIKKVLIYVLVAVAFIVQGAINLPIRDIVVMFYLANEGISLLENIAVIIPIPEQLKAILIQLRDKKKDEIQIIDKSEEV